MTDERAREVFLEVAEKATGELISENNRNELERYVEAVKRIAKDWAQKRRMAECPR